MPTTNVAPVHQDNLLIIIINKLFGERMLKEEENQPVHYSAPNNLYGEKFRRQRLLEERDNVEHRLRKELLDEIKADWIEYCKQHNGSEQDILAIEELFIEKKSCKKVLAFLQELHSFNKVCAKANLPFFMIESILRDSEKTADIANRKKIIEEKDFTALLTPQLNSMMSTEQPLCNKLAIDAVEQQLAELKLRDAPVPQMRL